MRPDGRAPRVKANLRREDSREEQPEPEERTLAPFVEQFFASPSSPKPFIFTVSSQYSPKLTILKIPTTRVHLSLASVERTPCSPPLPRRKNPSCQRSSRRPRWLPRTCCRPSPVNQDRAASSRSLRAQSSRGPGSVEETGSL